MSRPRGATHGWRPSRPRQKAILADLVARYRQHSDEGTLPRGPRGIFYDLRPNGIGNGISYFKPTKEYPVRCFDKDTEAHPAAVQEVLVLARRAGIIPEQWVADSRAPDPAIPVAFDGAEDFAAAVVEWIEQFRLRKQPSKELYVEVLCEAEDLIPRLARVAGEFGVPVYSGAGFDGLKPKRAFADRAMARPVPTIILQFGDFDQAGGWIFSSAGQFRQFRVDGHDGVVLHAGERLSRVVDQSRLAVSEPPPLVVQCVEASSRLVVLSAGGARRDRPARGADRDRSERGV